MINSHNAPQREHATMLIPFQGPYKALGWIRFDITTWSWQSFLVRTARRKILEVPMH